MTRSVSTMIDRLTAAHVLQSAATALVTGSEVATLNRTEFGRVPGLHLANLKLFVRA